MTIRQLAVWLHARTCVGAGDHCSDTSDHVTRFRAVAKQILTADDPYAALHDRTCVAHLHYRFHGTTIPAIHCRDRDGHIEAYRSSRLLDHL